MTLLVLVALALQDAEPSVAQDPKPALSGTGAVSTEEPVKKKKHKKKQEQEGELPGAARPHPEELKTKKPKKEDYQVDFRVGLTMEYNDNIIRLDKRDLEALADGTKPQKFRITQPQDWIYSPWGEADLALHVLGEPSTAGLRLTGHFFQVNSFASNGALSAFLKGKHFNLEYTYEPNVYRREYRNLDTGIYESAFYDDHLLEASMKFPIEKTVTLRPKVGAEIRDYDAPFLYRSSIAPFVAPRATLTIWKELEPFVQYEFVWNDAFATGVQPDTSYIQNGVAFGVHSKVLAELELEANYRYEYRVYTTNNDPSFDPSHAGRSDHRSRIETKIAWRALPNLTLEFAYAHWVVLSDQPGKPDLADDDSDWRRNEYSLGVTYIF
jgi:hypothetical protein